MSFIRQARVDMESECLRRRADPRLGAAAAAFTGAVPDVGSTLSGSETRAEAGLPVPTTCPALLFTSG